VVTTRVVTILASLVLLGSVAQTHSQSVPARRQLTLDDLFNLQQFGDQFGAGAVSFSPDNKHVALVIQRSRNKTRFFPHSVFARADVFIAALSGGQAINITNGIDDGVGYWAPKWSPDGKRLAMLSTRNDNICPWIWDQTSRAPRALSDRAVDILWYGADPP